jgi:hypothetical protein
MSDITPSASPAARWSDYQRSLHRSKKSFDNRDESTVSGATPAAFQGAQAGPEGYRPSAYEIYNTWAKDVLANLRAAQTTIGARVRSRQEFDVWHQELGRSLDAAWAKSAHGDFLLAPRQKWKLVNLFVKWLAPVAATRAPELKDAIMANGHVVLNTPTVRNLEELFGAEMPSCPAKPTEAEFLGWYNACQELVRTYTSADKYGGSPVLFDVWCRADYLSDTDA